MMKLLGQTLEELTALARNHGQPVFRGQQLAEWLYRRHAEDWTGMTNLPKTWRKDLDQTHAIGRHAPVETVVSGDGTGKYLFHIEADRYIETAAIPDEERVTLCLSTQVGCRRACAFCGTGRQGFRGDLDTADIINQFASCPQRERVTNIVFMGMGEPLDNAAATLRALDIFTAGYAYAMSPTRLTVSTVGVMPGLEQALTQSRCHIAISLHSPFDDERARLMPAQQRCPISDVIELLREHDFSGQRRLTFEIILFDGVNDTPRHARTVVKLLNPLRCRVNLIPFNPFPGIPFAPSPRPIMEAYQRILKDKGLTTTIRKSKGQDILAACGMLSTQRMEALRTT